MPDDEKPTVPPKATTAPAPKAASTAPTDTVSFRVWANRLDRATANAMRVHLGLKHGDLGATYSEAWLDAELATVFAPNPNRAAAQEGSAK